MRARRKHLGLWALVPMACLCLGQSPAYAQHELRGELGANLVVVDFENELAQQESPYAVRRGISDQFLSLGLRGPLYDPSLGSYNLRARLAGQYYRVGATSGDASEYTAPRPTALAASVGLFPGRRHPVRVYYARSELTALNYEQENRSVDDVESPELAAVRRYESSSESFGADVRYGISPTADVVVEAQRQESTSFRQYDFDEQRDIFVNFLTPSPDPTRPLVNIVVQNGIPEGDVILLVDGIIRATLLPDQQFIFELESGPHDVEFVPSKFNRFFAVVNVNGDMLWESSYTEPPGRTDVERSETAGRAEWVAGRRQRLENRVRLTYSDSYESVVGRNNLLADLENDLGFEWTPQSHVHSTTTLGFNQSEMQSGSDQTIESLRQKTRISYAGPGGGVADAEHSWDRTGTALGDIDLTTTQNQLLAQGSKPWGPYQHRMRARNTTTHVSNTDSYQSLENRTELTNDATLFFRRARINPRNMLGYNYTSRKNPESAFQELDWRPSVEFSRSRLWVLGDFTGSGEFGWRRRTEADRIDKTLRLGWSASWIRKFGSDYRLFGRANGNHESYDSQITTPGAEAASPRPAQKQTSFNAGASLQPSPMIGLTVSFGRTLTVDQQQEQIRADLTARIPWIDIPVTTAYSRQRRMITGRRDQVTTRWETRCSFTVRSVRVDFKHAYLAETLFSEDYALHTFSAEVARAFTVF